MDNEQQVPESTISPSPGCAGKVGRILLRTVLILFCLAVLLAIPIQSEFILEIPFHLFAGWAIFATKVIPTVAINWGLIASSLAALTFAVILLHRALLWLNKRNANHWSIRGTISISLLILVLFGASIASTGIGHQITWLKGMTLIDSGFIFRIHRNRNAEYLSLPLKAWAEEHHGRFPDRLSILVPNYIETEDELIQRASWRPAIGAEPELMLYIGAGVRDETASPLPLAISPRVSADYHHRRMVIFNDGRAAELNEKDFTRLMVEWQDYISKQPK